MNVSNILGFEELLSKEFKEVYLCRPLVPVGGRIVVGGMAKTFKSMLMLNMVYDLAEGLPLLGIWPCARPASVLVVEQEIGEARLKERMAKIHAHRQGQLVRNNLRFISKDNSVRLDTYEGRANLGAVLEESKPDVLVLDPLSKFHSKDENSFQAMKEMLDALIAIQSQHGFTLLMTHHAGKPSDSKNPGSLSVLRGHSTLGDDADTGILLERNSINESKITVRFQLRSDENPPKLDLRLDKDTLQFYHA